LVSSRAEPRLSPGGAFLGHIGLSSDITENRQAEQALRDSRELAQSTIDALSSHICVLNEAGTIIAVNQAWKYFAEANCRMESCEVHLESPGRSYFEGVNYLAVYDKAVGSDAMEAAEFARGIRAVLHDECGQYAVEYPCHSPDEKRWFIGRIRRFYNNRLTRIVIEHINITERKLAEEALRVAMETAEAAAQHYEFQHSVIRALHEVSLDGILVVNNDNLIASSNTVSGCLADSHGLYSGKSA
jgi:two-component system NtrC family sensor kinase